MAKSERLFSFITVFLLSVACLVFAMLLNSLNAPQLIKIFSFVSVFLILGLSAIASFFNFEVICKGCFIGSIIALIAIIVYYFSLKTGFIGILSSPESLKTFILKYDKWAIGVFIGVQFLQVTVLPLPSTITTLVGIALFGTAKAIIFSSIGIIAGSLFAFWLGRKFGVKLIVWICGRRMFCKYQQLLKGKDVLLLYAMFLLPFFPDDLLCLIAGLGSMSYKSFILMMLITRPVGALWVAGVFKSAVSIPFYGWGIVAWLAIIAITVLIFYLLFKYGDNITAKISYFTNKINLIFLSKFQKNDYKINIKAKKTPALSKDICRRDCNNDISKNCNNRNLIDYKN